MVALYLLFSPIGLVDGLSAAFTPLLGLILLLNMASWYWFLQKEPAPLYVSQGGES